MTGRHDRNTHLKRGGSCGTRASRKSLCNRIAKSLRQLYPHLQEVEQVGLRHIQVFIKQRKADGVTIRTMQNDVSHIRTVLKAAGRVELLRENGLKNSALGIAGGSRIGKKTPITDIELENLLTNNNDERLHCLLNLQRDLGLRSLEALRSDRSLARWQRELADGRVEVEIFYGTKGGRRRLTHLPDPPRALKSIEGALAVMGQHAHLAPGTSLKEAYTWYRNTCHRIGLQSHRLRYTFACECVSYYLALGYTLPEAFARTAVDLGHGDGRGRWIKMVYCRHKNFENM